MGILTKIIRKLKGHVYEESNQRPDGWGYIATWFICDRCGHEKVFTERMKFNLCHQVPVSPTVIGQVG
ncbi:hypothetical protein [Neobacillus driksii]|uniref:hypothetical protein n=1 Tax=Neobacillus driksii TaxID=3035913 RepID=UPI0027D86513|nr:hypothetical protein [Neobacillus niacini]